MVQEASGAEHPATCTTPPTHVVPHVELVTPGINFSAVLPKHGMGLSMETCIQLSQPGAGTISPMLTSTMHTILDELSACDARINPMCLRGL
ncbi:hypothetical protein B0H10DRAFT_2214706 [Mycena sp. CBHHK59/15]|nr:hypothetical protein B0H10DRAFT_2214706 [Mycena sp. CBHHK59/15]